MRALGIAPADVEPRATEHIAEVIEVVQRLVDRGLAYPAEGDVYYAVGSFAGYGQLSGQSTDDLKAGARIEIGEHKRSPLDFALWKGAKPGEPQWPSPWGPGRPGWHIECSAMAYRYLGETFDLHGGGSDLIFPHHENEIAQSEGAFGDGHVRAPLAALGHGELRRREDVEVAGQRGHDPRRRRDARSGVAAPADDQRALPQPGGVRDRARRRGAADLPGSRRGRGAARVLLPHARAAGRIAAAGAGAEAGAVLSPADTTLASFRAAMDDDFNTAAALGHLYESFVLANKLLDDPKAAAKDVRRRTLARLRADLLACGATLGIFQRTPSEFLLARRERICVRRNIDPGAVEARIAERAAARAAKDFARADEIRKALQATGIELMDSPGGTTWRVV